MITKTALKIRGFRGRSVPNSFYAHSEGSEALCVIFGGWHYTTEMPLFYYSRRVLTAAGYDVLSVDFRYADDRRYARLSDRKRQEIFLAEVRSAFDAPNRSGYRRILVGAKSLGTLALAHLTLDGVLGDEARLLWVSPLLEAESIRGTLAACTTPSLVVVGKRDPRYSAPLLKELGKNRALDIMIVEKGNEDLEIEDDAVRSIELLTGYMSRLRTFAAASGKRRTRSSAKGAWPASPLVSSRELIDHLDRSDSIEDERWVIVDCRFDLDQTDAGRASYVEGHVPGAVYAHLGDDLSSSPVTDAGRHPLPSAAQMSELFGRLGIDDRSRVVVYDDSNGMYASRLWWMLRYMGHDAVAVLDGGLADYLQAGGRLQAGIEHNDAGSFSGSPRPGWLVVKSEVEASARIFDARDHERYRGGNEQRDPRAGHIPGARSYPWKDNIGEDGRFLPPELIRERMTAALEGVPPEEAVFYCGSGVSACLDVLAAKLAGIQCRRVYVGSWSEWSRDEDKPVALGEE